LTWIGQPIGRNSRRLRARHGAAAETFNGKPEASASTRAQTDAFGWPLNERVRATLVSHDLTR
jgi:hypothetical protein